MKGKICLVGAMFWLGVWWVGREQKVVCSLTAPGEAQQFSYLSSVSLSLLSSLHTQATPSTCSSIPLLRTFPDLRSTLNSTHRSVTLSTPCFHSINMTLSYSETSSLTLTVRTGPAERWSCSEAFVFVVFGLYFPDIIFMSGRHIYEFRPLTPKSLGSFDIFGLKVFTLCSDPSELLTNGFILATLFSDLLTGGRYGQRPNLSVVEPAIVDFLNQSMGYSLEKRPQTRPELDFTTEIYSGDLLGVIEIQGPGAFIMYSTGARVSHLAMALWMSGNTGKELYVVETFVFGVISTKFAKWVDEMERMNLGVVLMPLKENVRARFNETAAETYFKSVEKTAYGWETFLYVWIDTPSANYPPPLTNELFLLSLHILEQSKPAEANTLLLEGLNNRLNTTGLGIVEAVKEAKRRGKTIYEVMAEPELEIWRYSNRSSMVCSAFAMKLYKEAGVGRKEIQAMEVTPRDLYSLNWFDKNATILQKCRVNDPKLDYCQLVGKFRIDLGSDYSSLQQTDYLFQSCPTMPPLYPRPIGC